MESPGLSIVVPTRDRPAQLTGLLEGLRDVAPPACGFEVVVVDDGGAGDLVPVCEPFLDHYALTLVRQPKAGCGAARNCGAAQAVGDTLVFTADDCIPAPDWLLAIERATAQSPGRLLGGEVRNGLPADRCASATHLLLEFLSNELNVDPEDAAFFTPNNMVVPADAFRELGGFDTAIGSAGEDREFCHRWRQSGRLLSVASEVTVTHRHPQTLPGFFMQHVRYGAGSRRFRRAAEAATLRSPEPNGAPRLVPQALGFYAALLASPLKQRAAARDTAAYIGLLGLSQVATACGVLGEALRPTEVETEAGSGAAVVLLRPPAWQGGRDWPA